MSTAGVVAPWADRGRTAVLGPVGAAEPTTLGRMDSLGPRLKELRREAGLSLRELARQADVSPSLVSQIENGKSRPSVSTLYTFARLLDVPVDDLFDTAGRDAADGPGSAVPAAAGGASGGPGAEDAEADGDGHDGSRSAAHDPANAWHPSEYATRISVIHPTHRAHLEMAQGVDWERLAATPERDVNFMKITYAPGATSTPDGELMSHEGYEYGYVIAGTVEVTVGDEVFVLRPGESMGFDSTIPHVLRNTGDVDVQGIWFVHGRHH